MLCPQCQIDLMIDHTGYVATGDNSPTELTQVFLQPYYRCPNPACTYHGIMLEGEKILVYADRSAQVMRTAIKQEPTAGTLIECCGQALGAYTDSTYSMTDAVYATAHQHADGKIDMICPVCGNVKQMPAGIRERTK